MVVGLISCSTQLVMAVFLMAVHLIAAQQCDPVVVSNFTWRAVQDISADVFLSSCKSCRPPILDLCKYDVASCDGVSPGQSCQIGCLAPFTGEPAVANCSGALGNADERLSWVLPDCKCPDPEPDPLGGYAWEPWSESWACALGFQGEAKVMCRSSMDCSGLESYFAGCEPEIPCSLPPVDPCRFDATACTSVQPGKSCLMHCKHPFKGASTIAECPMHNIDPMMMITWPPMVCIPDNCTDPTIMPEGYAYNSDGVLACADGYIGEIERTCMPGSDFMQTCQPYAVLSGCQKLQNCIPPNLQDPLPAVFPTVADTCYYDFGSCQNLEPGALCTVFCLAPYRGYPKNASCPEGNNDPNGMIFDLPTCTTSICGTVEVWPEGYVWSDIEDKWKCEPGFSGTPKVDCLPVDPPTCGARPILTGCRRISPCQMVDTCKLDFSDCQSVLAGSTCQVGCRAPFIGSSTTAYCDQYNEDVDGLQWTEPTCTTGDCLVPLPTPTGYFRGDDGVWTCDNGYTGRAVKVCVFNADMCMDEGHLSGCVLEAPCRAPFLNVSPEDKCKLDFSECDSLPAGRHCQVKCKQPWVGNPSYGECPPGNTNPYTEVQWSAPYCDCPDPENAPPGYEFTPGIAEDNTSTWNCAPGQLGIPSKICRPAALASGNCVSYVESGVLTGCESPTVCEVTQFWDEGSTRHSGISGLLEFGQSSINGEVYEDGVTGYRIAFADVCGTLLSTEGEKLLVGANGSDPSLLLASAGFVTRNVTAFDNFDCCKRDAYALQLENVQVPPGATQMLLVVATGNESDVQTDSMTAVRVPIHPSSMTAEIFRSEQGAGGGKPASSSASSATASFTIALCLCGIAAFFEVR